MRLLPPPRSRRAFAARGLIVCLATLGAGCWPTFADPTLRRTDASTDAPPTDAIDAAVDASTDARDVVVSDASDAGTDAPSDTGDSGCGVAPMGPFTAERFTSGVMGARDLAFNGSGRLATIAGRVVLFDSIGAGFDLSGDIGGGVGIRYLTSGDLAVTTDQPDGGAAIRVVAQTGAVRTPAMGYATAGALAAHPSGAVYFSDRNANTIRRLAGDLATVTNVRTDVSSPTGLAFSADYRQLYVGSPATGQIHVIELNTDGTANAPRRYADAPFSAHGLAFDRCGYLYASDFDGMRIMRIPPGGGAAEAIATLTFHPWGIAFGQGAGFDARALYVVDADTGAIHRIPVGAEAGSIVTPR